MFPNELVPDGAVFAPHHYTYAVLLVLLVLATVWDNYPGREPLLAAVGAGVGLFGFLSVWPYYPAPGAILSLAGPVIVVAAVALGSVGTVVGGVWDDYPARARIAAGVFAVVALDDAIEHAFGWPTPLDLLWNGYLSDHATIVFPAAVAAVAFVVTIVSVYTE